MANTTASPNMNMPVPTVSEDPGPDWATNVDACLSIVDEHNHTTGQGVQVPSAGLNINADLPCNINNLTTVRSTRYSAQAAPLSAGADIGCTYVSGVDLYYNDSNGNQVRLTASGNPSGGAGSITGLPSGTAAVAYSAPTYSFTSATNTPASVNTGPLKIARNVSSGKGLTLSAASSTSADFAWTLPNANPSATSMLTVGSTGTLGYQAFLSSQFTPTSSQTHISGGTVTITQDTLFGYYYQMGSIVFVHTQIAYTLSAYSATPANYRWTQPIPVGTTTLYPAGTFTDQSNVSAPIVAVSNTSVTFPTGVNVQYTANGTSYISFTYAYIIN